MRRNLINLTEKDIQKSCEKRFSSSPDFTDMSEYYTDKLYDQDYIVQQEEVILGVPISEVANLFVLIHHLINH